MLPQHGGPQHDEPADISARAGVCFKVTPPRFGVSCAGGMSQCSVAKHLFSTHRKCCSEPTKRQRTHFGSVVAWLLNNSGKSRQSEDVHR